MNYLAQGLTQGFATGAEAREKKKDRKQRDAEREAEKALRLEMDARLTEREKALQGDRITADAKRQFSDQAFRGIEADKGRVFSREERIGGQGYQSEEADKGRAFQGVRDVAQRLHEKDTLKTKLDQDAAQFKESTGLNTAALGLKTQDALWDRNPDNPKNKVMGAQAKYYGSKDPIFEDEGPQLTPNGQRTAGVKESVTKRPPSPEAIAWLKQNPNTKAQFDEIYGPGAATRYLNGTR
jgi:hypothetical protein